MAIKFSIGIPLYRQGPQAEFSVQSALNQSRQADQIVIVDNLPSRSESIIKRWRAQGNVTYINNGQNIGAFNNFVRAWELSSHRYFTWLADDDFLHPEALAAYELNIMNTNDSCILAWCGLPSVFFPSTGSRITGSYFSSFSGQSLSERLSLMFRYSQWNFPFYSMFDRTKISIEWMKSFKEWPLGLSGMDWDWTFTVAAHGSVKLIPSHLYFYNQKNWSQDNDWIAREVTSFRMNLDREPPARLSVEDIQALSTRLRIFLFILSSFGEDLKFADINSLFGQIFLSQLLPQSALMRNCYKNLGLNHLSSNQCFLVRILEAIEHVKPGFTLAINSFGFSPEIKSAIKGNLPRGKNSIWGPTPVQKILEKIKRKVVRNDKQGMLLNCDLIYLPRV